MITIKPTGQNPTQPVNFRDLAAFVVYFKQVYEWIYRIWQGKTNNLFTFTLSTGTTTIVKNVLLDFQSVLVINALTENARQIQGSVACLQAGRARGQFTLTHNNNVNTDCEFVAAVIG